MVVVGVGQRNPDLAGPFFSDGSALCRQELLIGHWLLVIGHWLLVISESELKLKHPILQFLNPSIPQSKI
jgi:hypothetical protein